MSLRSAARSGLLSVVSALTGRHAVLLPREAVDRRLLVELDRGDLVTRVALRE